MTDNKEIFPEAIYMTIPTDYVCIYHKLVMLIADFGKDIIDDCTASCGNPGKHIISCWSLFQSAVANYNLGKKKEAEFFINYIEKQLELVYKGNGGQTIPTSIPVRITDDGRLKAVLSCNNGVHFVVDVETGKLYQEYIKEQNGEQNYYIKNDNLIYENKNLNL